MLTGPELLKEKKKSIQFNLYEKNIIMINWMYECRDEQQNHLD